MSPRAREIKEKINEWGHIKLNSFCTVKETIMKMKREPTLWENIFAKDTLGKSLISKIYKELMWLNTRKTNNTIKKWAKNPHRHFSKDIQMAKRHEKMLNISTSYQKVLSQRGKIKPQGDHLIPAEMATINKLANNKCWWIHEKRGPWRTVHAQTGAATLGNSMELHHNKMELSFDPMILLLGVYSKNPKPPIQKNMYTPTFIAASFMIAKIWKQPMYP